MKLGAEKQIDVALAEPADSGTPPQKFGRRLSFHGFLLME
jgi:hypothetical protein